MPHIQAGWVNCSPVRARPHYYQAPYHPGSGHFPGLVRAAYLAFRSGRPQINSAIEARLPVARQRPGKNFRDPWAGNIEQIVGDFDPTLCAGSLDRNPGRTLGNRAVIDVQSSAGAHPPLTLIPCLGQLSSSSVSIFDDIHWSEEMEQAWGTDKGAARTR